MPLSLYTNLSVTADLLPRLLLSLERPQAQSNFPKNRSQCASSARPIAAAAAVRFIPATTCRKLNCESLSRRRRLDEGATRIVSGTRSVDNALARVPRAAKHGQHPLLARGHLLSRPRAYFSTSDAPKQPVDEEEETQPHAPTESSHDSDSALEKRELLWNTFINPNALHRTDPERKVIRKYFNLFTLCMKKLGELRALESIRVSVSRPDATGVAGADNPDTFVGRREVYEWKAPTLGQPRMRAEKWEKQVYNGAVKRLKSLGFHISVSQSRSTGDAQMQGNEDAYGSAGFRREELTERQNILAEERVSTDADTKTSVLNDEGPAGSQELSQKANAEGQKFAGQEDTAVPRIETVWDELMRQSEKLMAIGVKDQNLGSDQEEPTEVKGSAAQKRAFNLSELVNDAPTSRRRRMERAEAEKQCFSRPSPNGTPRPTIHTIHEIFSCAPFARKSQQDSLPPYEYWERDADIQVVYVRDHRHADIELQRTFYPTTENRLSRIVGFDAEWRPSWRDEFPENAVSLVQLARGKRILLLQISAMRTFPKKLIEFLDDETFIKAGVDIQSDAQRLYRDYAVITRSCVELSHLARAVDRDRWPGDMRQLISLARLVQSYNGRLLTKGSVRTSNWEDELTESQQRYAANDAHAGLTVATSLLKRGNHIDRSLFMFDIVRANAVHADSQFWHARSPSGFPAPPVKKKKKPPPPPAAYSELLSSFHIPADTEVVSRRGTKAKAKTNVTDLISILARQTQRDASQNI